MLKEHKKMYKAGKNWLVMGITSFAVVGAVSQLDNMGIKSAKAVMPNQTKQVASADQRDFNTKPYVGHIMGNEIDFDSYEDAIIGRYMDIPVTRLLDSDDHYLNMGFQNVYVHLNPDTGDLDVSIMRTYSKLLIRQDTGSPIEFHWNPQHGPGTGDHEFTISNKTNDWAIYYEYYQYAKFYLFWRGQRYDFNFAQWRTQPNITNPDIPAYKKKAADFASHKNDLLMDLQAARDAAKAKIDNNDGLLDTQKKDIKNKIDQAYEDGVDKMESDAKQADIDTDGNNAKATIQKLGDTQGVDVAAKKKEIKANFESEAEKIIAKINADNGLTSAQKKTQIDAVNTDVTNYSNKIDNDKKLEAIYSDSDAGIKAIDSEYHAGDLAKVKTDAKAKIDALATKLLAKISQDDTLTSDQKTSQTNKVKADQAKYDQEIDQAANADDAIAIGNTDFSSDYQPGDSLDDQKAAAKAKIAAEAKRLIDAINADKTLPQTVRQTQIDAVNSDAKTADDYIDASRDADAINSATGNGIHTMDGAYKPGDPLPTQKKNAKDKIQDELNKIIAKINADKTLTRAEKDAEIAKAKQDAQTIDTNIDNASDADTVNQTYASGIKTIDGDYKAGKSIDQQKQEAKDKVDKEAAAIIKAINDDKTLTADQRAQQIAQVNRDKAAADQNIANADNADDINTARDTGINKIDSDHVPGASLADQRAAAKHAIDNAAQAAIDAINNDATLSSDQKTAQVNAVNAAKDAAYNAIDQAGDADGINTARDNGVNTINGIHQPGTPVSDRKGTAKQSLEDEARRVIAAIKADNTLTTDQKNEQIAAVNRDLTAAESNIDAATTADGINTAFNTGKQKIDDDHVPGESLDQQKKDAKDKIDKEAARIIDLINKDATISAADKAAQIAAVNADKTKAENSIDAATNVDGVNNAVTEGISAIDGDYVPGQSLDQQKQEAKDKVDAEAKRIINEINADNTLTAAEKAAQVAKVQTDRDNADRAIDQATDHDSIQSAMSTGIGNIDKDYVPGESLDARKAAAKAALDAEAKRIIAAIKADNTLTESQKENQINWVNHDEESYDNTIDSDGSADAIENDLQLGIKEIDAEHVPGQSLDDQKNNAKKAIDDAAKQSLDGDAKKAIAGINNDPTLPAAEKQKQIDKVNDDRRKALAGINNAKDADGINDATNKGKAAIAGDYVPGKSLADQKKEAKGNVDAEAAKIIAAIKADNTLTDAQKQTQIQAVENDQTNADNAIDAATSADGINQAESSGINKIDGDHVPGASLDNQKKDAKANLEKEAKTIIAAIQADNTLTAAEKAAQIAQVNTDKQNAENAIDGAQNADQIASDFVSGKKAIDGDHKPGTPLDTHKSDLKKDLDGEAKKIIDEINADNSLSNAQKQAQINQVNQDKTNAENAIDAATNTDDMNDAYDAGKRAIDGDYHPGKPLPDQKKDEKANLESEAQRIIDAINADNTLTQTEKNKQIAQVKADLATAEGKIDAANNQDDVTTAFNNGKTTIDGDHKPGLSLDQQKKNAKAAIDQRAQDLINQINADNTLTATEKANQINKVQNDQQAADSNIDEASNADGVNQAKSDGMTTLNGDYHSGLSLDQQKQNAKAKVDAEAKSVIDQINADDTLTQDEKTAQINKVKADQANADTAIDQAKNADDINTARDNGIKNIDAAHHAGAMTLDQRKQAAQHDIDQMKNAASSAIENDPTLTSGEKQDEEKALTDAYNAANAAINKEGATAQDIQDAWDTGKTAIPGAHKASTSVADRQAAAKAAVEKRAAEIKQDIENDKNLLRSEKDAMETALQNALNQAETDLTNAQNADSINSTELSAITNVESSHQSAKESLKDRQDKAKADLDRYKQDTSDAIDNDKTLDGNERATEHNNLNNEYSRLLAEIEAQNVDAQGVYNVVDTMKANIEGQHKAGQSVSDRQDAARKAVEKQASDTDRDIDNDNTLTSAQKLTQKNNVAQALADAEQNINKADSADNINTAQSSGLTSIKGAHQSADLNKQKQDAQDKINALRDQMNQKIHDEATLSDAEKQDEYNAVQQAWSTANDAINKDGATAQNIQDALNNGTRDIPASFHEGESVVSRQDKAKKALEDEFNKIKDAIQKDKNLTDAERNSMNTVLQADYTTAVNNVENDKDAQSIINHQAAGIQNIDQAKKEGAESLADRQQDAKSKIDNWKNETNSAIENDKTLDKDQKGAQQKRLMEMYNALIKDIMADDATSQTVVNVMGHAQTDIEGTHQGGINIDTQKAAAKSDIQKEYDRVKEAIQNDSSLLDSEKAEMLANLETAKNTADENIGNADNADSIESLKSSSISSIDATHTAKTPLAARKAQAQNDLEQWRSAANNDIAQDNSLTTAEKKTQYDAVTAAYNEANKALNADGASAQNMADALSKAKPVIQGAHHNGKSVADRIKDAESKAKNTASDTHDKINRDVNLTQDEKNKMNKDVDTALTNALTSIDGSKSADEVNTNLSDGQGKIEQAYGSAEETLAARKDAALKRLDTLKQQADDSINNDTTLTDTEKRTQLQDVLNAYNHSKGVITNADVDAEGIVSEMSKAETNLPAVHKNGQSLADRKKTAKGEIQNQYDAVKKAIQNDKDLLDSEKQTMIANLDAAKTDADNAVDQAKDADAVNGADSSGQENLEKTHTAGAMTAADRKQHADSELDDLYNKTKDAIQNDQTLDVNQKQAQLNALDEAYNAAKGKVDAEGANAQAIQDGWNEGDTTMPGKHQAGESVEDRKKNAKTAAKNAADEANRNIDADKTLTSAEKKTQHGDVAKALTAAESAIDQATDADGVNSASGAGNQDILSKHVAGEPLDQQKKEAMQLLNNLHDSIENAINQDATLTTDDKNAEKANLEKAYNAAKEAIEKDDADAESIYQAKQIASTAIPNSHTTGDAVRDRQNKAEDEAKAWAKRIKDEIDADKSLTNNEKSTMKGQVDKDLNTLTDQIGQSMNADAINGTLAAGKTTLSNDHKAGEMSLADRKNQAKDELEKLHAKIRQEIQDDSSLAGDDKTEQIDQLDSDYNDAVNAIDGDSADAQLVADTLNKGKSFLPADHKRGKTISERQAAAEEALNRLANQIKAAINADDSLTNEEKGDQIQNVQLALTNADSAISKAGNADLINQAEKLGETNIKGAHTAGAMSLADRKSDAQKKINKLRDDTHDAIEADNTLTRGEKDDEERALEEAYQNANTAINKDGVNAQGLVEALSSANTQIPGTHQNGESIDNRKKDAKQAVRNAADEAEKNLSGDEKQAVENAADAAYNYIDQQNSADAINTARDQQVQNIQGLASAKASARNALNKKAHDAENTINGKAELTSQQKQDRVAAIEKALTQALHNVAVQTTVTASNDAANANLDLQADGQTTNLQKAIDAGLDMTGIDSLDDQKKNAESTIDTAANKAKDGIDQAASAAKQDIDNNDALTDAEKAAQKAAVDGAATNAKNAISSAKDADGIDKAEADGVNTIQKLHESMANARKKLTDKVKAAIDNINNNNDFSGSDKQDKINKIKDAYKKALDNVDDQKTLPDADNAGDNAALDQAITDGEKNTGQTLDQRKQSAKDAIRTAADENEKNLSDAQKKAMEQAVTNAYNKLDSDNNADQVDSDRTKALTNINGMNDAKDKAYAALNKKFEDAEKLVNQQNQLTQADKNGRIARMKAALQAALSNVDNQNETSAVSTDNASFDQVVQEETTFNGKSLDQIKQDAKDAIRQAANDEEKNLSDAQKQAMEKAVENADNAINEKGNADDVLSEQAAQLQNIRGLNNAKTASRAALNKQAGDAEKIINGMKDLNAQEKRDRINRIQQALTDALNNVDQQVTVQGAQDAANNAALNQAIADGEKPNPTSLDSRKQNDIATIIRDRDNAKAKVEENSRLSGDQKAAQEKALDNAAQKAIDNINGSNDADAVDAAFKAGDDNINGLNQAKNDAYDQLKAQAAAAENKINGNNDLTDGEKSSRVAAVEAALAAAEGRVDAAENVSDVTASMQDPTFNNAMDKNTDFGQVESLAKRKHDAEDQIDRDASQQKSNIDNVADAEKQAIDNNGSLTANEKAAMKAAIDEAVKKAKQNIENANDASSVDKALADGENTINNLYQHMVDARARLSNQAKDAVANINGNNDLKQDEKAKRIAKVQAAFDKALDNVDNQNTLPDVDRAADNAGLDQAIADAESTDGVQNLDDRKKNAKSAIEDAKKAAYKQVDDDSGLSDTEKQAEKSAIDSAANDAENKIANAKDASDSDDARDAGIKNIAGLYQAKHDAREALKSQAKAGTDQVASNNDLTDDDRAKRLQKIQDALKAALQNVDRQTTDSAATSANPNADLTKAIKEATDFSTIQSLADRKKDAKAAIDGEAGRQKSAIDSAADAAEQKVDQANDLTPSEKVAIKAAIEQARQNADQAIDNAGNASGVDQAEQKGLDNLKNLVSAMQNSRKRLADKAKAAMDKVNGNNNFTNQDKKDRVAKIQKAYNAAVNNVDDKNTVDDANAAGDNPGLDQAILDAESENGNQSLADRKNAAKAAIKAAVLNEQAKTNNDSSLSAGEKADRNASLSRAGQAAENNIDNATDASAVDEQNENGLYNINNLDQAKKDSFDSLNQRAEDAKNKVRANKALKQSEKDDRIKKIDAALQDAKNNVDSKDTVQAAHDAANNANFDQALNDDTDFSNVTPVDNRKQNAKDAIKRATDAQKQAVDNDTTLDGNAKDAQKRALDFAQQDEGSAIDQAGTADEIDAAEKAGLDNTNGLGDTKKQSRDSLKQKAKQAEDTINSDKKLTKGEREERVKKVEAALKSALSNVDDQTTVQKAKDAANNADFNQVLDDNTADSGSQSLDDRKNKADSAIDTAAKQAKDAIDKNADLSDGQKTDQKAAIDRAAQSAKNDITQAEDASGVDDAKAAGLENINGLNQAKNDSFAALKKKAQDADDRVDADKNLTGNEKAERKQKVADALKKALDHVDEQDTVPGARAAGQNADFDQALGQATDFTNVEDLGHRKQGARDDIDNNAKKAKEAIDADNLTPDEKDRQKKAVDAAANKAKNDIDNAQDADGVDKAKAAGDTNLNGLNDAKQNARKKLNDAAQKAKDKIQGNKNLSKDDKAKRQAKIDDALKHYDGNVDDQTTVPGAEAAGDDADFYRMLDDNTDGGDIAPLDNQKKADRDAIDNVAKKAKQAVDGNNALDADAKKRQKDAIDKAAQHAKDNIDHADNADDAKAAEQDGENTINGLAKAKNDARNELDGKAKKAMDDIDNNPDLPDADKNKRKNKIKEALKKAHDKVDDATTPGDAANDGDNADLDGAINDNTDFHDVTPLDQQKSKAKADLKQKAQKTIDQINADKALTQSEKDRQIQGVNNALDRNDAAIDAAKNAQTVDDIVNGQDVLDNIVNGYHPAKQSFKQEQDDLKKHLADVAFATKNQIEHDSTLSAREKAEQTANVDKALAKAEAAVDNAPDYDVAMQAEQVGEKAIKSAHKAGTDLDNQKKKAFDDLKKKAEDDKKQIIDNNNLSDREKAAEIATLDAEIARDQTQLTNAKNPDEIQAVDDRAKRKFELDEHKKKAEKDKPSRVDRFTQESVFAALPFALSYMFMAAYRKFRDKDK